MGKYEGKTLLVLGDSIMFGSGNGGVGVGELIKEKYSFKLLKYCIGGARVGYNAGKSWVVEQVRKAVNDGVKPDLIVFDGFTNDCNISEGNTLPDVVLGERLQGADVFSVTEEDDFSFCFASVAFSLCKYFPYAKKLFVRPHKMGRRDAVLQKSYGGRAVEICKIYGIEVVDLYSECDMDTFKASDRDEYTADTYGWGRGDCTHPNANGYAKKYMPHIFAAIEKLLK